MGLLRSKNSNKKLVNEDLVQLRAKLLEFFSNENIMNSHNEFERECREFFANSALEKVFSDSELITTSQLFFEHNLDISLTSKAGYMHRNTLIYRLDKIKSIVGLDVREFKDACVFKNIIYLHSLYNK